jgi:hypothetical protein
MRIRDVEKGLALQRLILEDIQKSAVRQAPAQHHYRFERNGASLWRYDETTGESCQVTSNQIDKWVGGHCPIAPQEQQQQERAFVEALCKDNPNSDSCKALLKEKH